MADINTRDAKLIQYLTEAFGNEKRLETALEAHIGMTAKPSYKTRLRRHLSETKGHARELERRIKKLGGHSNALADVTVTLTTGAGKAMALAQGPIDTLRGTGEAERQLKNAKSEYTEEAHEIAQYDAIDALATAVGDKETARLVRSIRREEERMRSFLEKEIERLAKAVARAEIPAAERNGGTRRRRTRSRGTRARSTGSRTTGSRTTGSRSATTRRTTSRSAGTRATGTRSSSGLPSSGSRSTALRGTARTRGASSSRSSSRGGSARRAATRTGARASAASSR